MRGLLRGLAWGLVALGFLAVGADAYWSWKAHQFSFRSVGFYLDLANGAWATDFQIAATRLSDDLGQLAVQSLTWPVWGPVFVLGFVLSLLTRPARDISPR